MTAKLRRSHVVGTGDLFEIVPVNSIPTLRSCGCLLAGDSVKDGYTAGHNPLFGCGHFPIPAGIRPVFQNANVKIVGHGTPRLLDCPYKREPYRTLGDQRMAGAAAAG